MVLAGVLLKLGRYGLARIYLALNLSIGLLWVIVAPLLLALMARIITLLQSDTKKFIAYRSVTHITFLLVGLLSRSKLLIARVVMTSLAHGWTAIGLFSTAGLISHAVGSRIRALLRTETNLQWTVLWLSGLFISNASVPPLPSFFPEVCIVLVLSLVRVATAIMFIGMRFIICYYNAYLFRLYRQVKPYATAIRRIKIKERVGISRIITLRLVSLLWLKRV